MFAFPTHQLINENQQKYIYGKIYGMLPLSYMGVWSMMTTGKSWTRWTWQIYTRPFRYRCPRLMIKTYNFIMLVFLIPDETPISLFYWLNSKIMRNNNKQCLNDKNNLNKYPTPSPEKLRNCLAGKRNVNNSRDEEDVNLGYTSITPKKKNYFNYGNLFVRLSPPLCKFNSWNT
jgi:hypothetical protein